MPRSVSPHFYAVLAFVLFAVMNSCIKSLHGTVDVPLILCTRFFVSFATVALATGSIRGFREKIRTKNMKYNVFRAVIAVISSGAIFYVMPHVPLAEINVLGQTYPFFLMILSTYILKESVNPKQYISCVLGFVGVLLIVRPSGDIGLIFSLLVLAAAVLNAAGDLTVRWMTRSDDEITIMLWFFLLTFLFSFAWCAIEVGHFNLTFLQGEYLFCAGIMGGAAQYFLTKAYKRLKAGTMAAYSYMTLCMAVIFGWSVFHEIPTLWMVAGGLFIMAGVQWNYLVSAKAARSR